MINISITNNDLVCETAQEAIRIIRSCARSGKDEIWLSGENKYPCIAIIVNKNYACINFFEEENEGMFLSYNDRNDTAVTFLAGGEEWEAPKDAVISLDDAVLCAKAFIETKKKPECIRWQEL